MHKAGVWLHTQTHTHNFCTCVFKQALIRLWQGNTGRMCISHAAVEHRASEVGSILRTLISCFRMSRSTHTQTQSVRLELCDHAVNPWIRPFNEWRTAEGWSLLPLSACIPTWLTAACQNTRAVSGKLWIKVRHLECHQTRRAELHVAIDSNTETEEKERKKEKTAVRCNWSFGFAVNGTSRRPVLKQLIWPVSMWICKVPNWLLLKFNRSILWWEEKKKCSILFFLSFSKAAGGLEINITVTHVSQTSGQPGDKINNVT